MSTNTNKRSIETTKKLQSALIEIMQDKTFSDITIKEICDYAKLNRTTFYLHYPNQEALLADIQQDAFNESSKYIRTIRLEEDSLSHITLLLEYIRQNPLLFRMLLCNNKNNNYSKAFFTQHISEIIRERKIDGATGEQIEYVNSYIMNGCLGLIISWLENDFDIASEKLALLIYKLCDGAYSKATNTNNIGS